MPMLIGMGRALGIIAAERRGHVLAAKEKSDDAMKIADERPTIMVAYDNTNTLLERMQLRARRLQDYIDTSTEELRQVMVVLDAATKMRETIAAGMDKRAAPLTDIQTDDRPADLSANDPDAFGFTPSELLAELERG